MDNFTLNNNRRTKEGIIKQLMKGKPGWRARCNANCVDCVYDESQPGSWRKQVQDCEITECAFWEVRAKQCIDVKMRDMALEARYHDKEGKAAHSSV